MPTWGVSPGPFERHAQSRLTEDAFVVCWLLCLWSIPAYLERLYSVSLLVTPSIFLRQVISSDFSLCADIAFKVHVWIIQQHTEHQSLVNFDLCLLADILGIPRKTKLSTWVRSCPSRWMVNCSLLLPRNCVDGVHRRTQFSSDISYSIQRVVCWSCCFVSANKAMSSAKRSRFTRLSLHHLTMLLMHHHQQLWWW